MEDDSPRDRREGRVGPFAPPATADTHCPRHRFREFLAGRMGGVTEAAWYIDQVMPKLGEDPEARLAAEELLDHLARLMRLEVVRNADDTLGVWTSDRGVRIAVALVDGFEAVAGIGRAVRATEDLYAVETLGGSPLAGLLCVMAGEVRRRPIEQLLEVRRMSHAVRVVGLASMLSIARAVEDGTLSADAAAALLEPGVFADALVAHLTEVTPRGAP